MNVHKIMKQYARIILNVYDRRQKKDVESCIERRTVNRGDGGSIPPTAVSKLRQFRSLHICQCLSEETLKAGGPFCLVSMPGEVKDPTQGINV